VISFCDCEKSTLLVGDAALSLNFLYGDGINTALHSASILGRFFEEFLES
jgi:flavin-dependent dehydrogenase